MADVIHIEDAATGYATILDNLLKFGDIQESRNGRTIEIEDLVIELENPEYATIGGARDGYNEAIGMVEGLQLIAGISDSSLTCEIQPNFRAFMDNGEFWGAYGPRTADQLPVIASRLYGDNDTRQAVVTLWDPKYDTHGGKQDHPCTTAFNFRIRGDKLNMTTFMRSNDAYWGWPYDVYQFCMLQTTLANVLGIPVGTYTHHAASFHLYEPHWSVAEELVGREPWTTPSPKMRGFAHQDGPHMFFGWEQAKAEATAVWHVVRGVAPASVLTTDTQKFYASRLLERKIKVAQMNYDKLIASKS